jgi:hypothetical protein
MFSDTAVLANLLLADSRSTYIGLLQRWSKQHVMLADSSIVTLVVIRRELNCR